MDFDINVLQGATFKMLATIKDPDENPIDLTGYEFRGQIRQTTSSDEVAAEFTFEVQTQSGPTLGQVLCLITPEQTSGIKVPGACSSSRKVTKMVYDIESENTATGEVIRWLQGTANISPEVTRNVPG